MKTLNKLRQEIDKIDEEVQQLITDRANLALKIGKIKNSNNNEKIIYRPERETEILQKITSRNQGPLENNILTDIFKTIISANRSLQRKLSIAFLGPLGTFSHEATIKKFGEKINLIPQPTVKNIIQAVEQGDADYALIPIENSTEGVVNKALDALIDSQLNVCAEETLPINHHLLSRENGIKNITQVYSHQQALAQCQQWLEKNLPNAALFPAKSTAQACMLAAREANTAAIAGKIALQHHHLNVIASNIEDDKKNMTRFYILAKQETSPTNNDKTSALIWTSHKPGALANLLNHFSSNGINLTLIESRPSKQKNWEYYFFLEMEGHQKNEPLNKLIANITETNPRTKILGSFPRST